MDLESKLLQDEIKDISYEEWNTIYNDSNLRELFLRRVKEGILFDIDSISSELVEILISKEYIRNVLECYKAKSYDLFLDIFNGINSDGVEEELGEDTYSEVLKYYNENKEDILNQLLNNIANVSSTGNIDLINLIIKNNLGEYASIISVSKPSSEIEDFIINNLDKTEKKLRTYSKRIEEACQDREKLDLLYSFYKESDDIANAILRDLSQGAIDFETLDYGFQRDYRDNVEVIKHQIVNKNISKINDDLIDRHPELEDFVIDLIEHKELNSYCVEDCYNHPKIMAAIIENLYSISELRTSFYYSWDIKLNKSFEKDPERILDAISNLIDKNVGEAEGLLATISYLENYQKFDRIIKKIVSSLTFDQIIEIFEQGYDSPLRKILNEYTDYYNYTIMELSPNFDTMKEYNETILLSVIPHLDINQLDYNRINEAYFATSELVEAIIVRLAQLNSDRFNNNPRLFRNKLTPKARDILISKDNPLNLTITQLSSFFYNDSELDSIAIGEIIKAKYVMSSADFCSIYRLLVSAHLDERQLATLSVLLNANIEVDDKVYQIIDNFMPFLGGDTNDHVRAKELIREFLLKRENVPLYLTSRFDEEVRKHSTYNIEKLSLEPELFYGSVQPDDFKEFVFNAIKNHQPVDLTIIYSLVRYDKANYALLTYNNLTYNHDDNYNTIQYLLSQASNNSIEESCIYHWLLKTDVSLLFNENIGEYYNGNHEIVKDIIKNEKLFRKLIELTRDKYVTYEGHIFNALTYDYSDEFKGIAIKYIEKLILNNQINIRNLKLTKELVEMNNPIIEKFLTEEYFAKSSTFPWLTSDVNLFFIIKNKSIYYDALMKNFRENKSILYRDLRALDNYPELVDIYIESIRNKSYNMHPNIPTYKINYLTEVIRAVLETDPDKVVHYVISMDTIGMSNWLDDEGFNTILNYAVDYYHINKNATRELVRLYGYRVLSLVTDERAGVLFKLDVDTIKKFTEIFKVRELDFKSIEAINDSFQQTIYTKQNSNDISLYTNILVAIQRGITQEEINNIVNMLCKTNENGKYLYMNDSLIIKDSELAELYKSISREDFVRHIINLVIKDVNKYAPILNMITSHYIEERRNEVTRNEDIYRDTDVQFKYDKRQLYDAYFNILKKERNAEYFFISELIRGYKLGYEGDNRIDELTIKYLCNPESITVSKEDLILIKKNIRSVKERLADILFCQYVPEDFNEESLKNVKKTFVTLERILSIEDFERMNIEAILKIIENKEQYDLLIEFLDKYKFLDWGVIFNRPISEILLNNGNINLFNFINAFGSVYANEQRQLAKISREREGATLKSIFNASKILKYSSIYSLIANGYSVLFGLEDCDLIIKNDGPNKASDCTSEDRLEYNAQLYMQMIQTKEVTIPSFIKEYEVNDNKKLRALVGCKADTRNLTVGERTGACLRAYGHAKELFTFANSDPRGFNIIFENPKTGKFVSRITGFRNGNTVFLNELRESVDSEYSNQEVIDVCLEMAKELVELSKDSDMPIENVVVSPDQILVGKETQSLSERDIGTGVFDGYRNVSSNAVVLATTGENGIAMPLKLDGNNQPIYRSRRLPVREYKYFEVNDSIKVLMQRVDVVKRIIEDKTDVTDYIKTVDFDFNILDNEYIQVILGQDFYVALDKEGNLIHNIAVITDESEKEYQEAMEKVEEIRSRLMGGMEDGRAI